MAAEKCECSLSFYKQLKERNLGFFFFFFFFWQQCCGFFLSPWKFVPVGEKLYHLPLSFHGANHNSSAVLVVSGFGHTNLTNGVQ